MTECQRITDAECLDSRSSALSSVSMDQFNTMLRYALSRMTENAGSEPFRKPVDETLVSIYVKRNHSIIVSVICLLEHLVRVLFLLLTIAFLTGHSVARYVRSLTLLTPLTLWILFACFAHSLQLWACSLTCSFPRGMTNYQLQNANEIHANFIWKSLPAIRAGL